ncbi:hypothetical protein MHYP_G00005220 [Metynnis hypsauchen]
MSSVNKAYRRRFARSRGESFSVHSRWRFRGAATHWDRTLSDKDKQSEGGDLTPPHSAEPPESPISADPTGSDDIFQCGAQNPVQTSKDCSAPVGPDDISQSRAGGPVQPVLKVFPKTQHGNRKRALNESWYRDYTWLEYSISRDSVFCYACRHFSLPNAPSSVFRTETGFSNWKKALCKEGGFKDHSQSEHHRNAMFSWKQHEMATQTKSCIIDSINKEREKKMMENQAYIKTIAEVLLLTATQNISQRGHRESEDSDNRGNFLAILEEIAKHDSFLEKRMKAHGNAKYTSKTIQNEMLECLAEMVQEEIIREVKQSEVFSIIADETKDLQKKEQVSLVIRYYYRGVIHEGFLDFMKADSLDAAGLTALIIKCLEKHGLEYRTNLVGQGYDGAAVMSGKHSDSQQCTVYWKKLDWKVTVIGQ